MNQIIKIPFVKMSAAGNDFILLDATQFEKGVLKNSQLAEAFCERHRGVGGDGLLILNGDNEVDFMMDYYNSDGSTGGMCGNGARCISGYFFDKNENKFDSTKFRAFDYIYTAHRKDDTINITMKNPTNILTDIQINVDGIEIPCNYVDTGAPHVILYPESLSGISFNKFDKIDIIPMGRKIRFHEAFKPLGANVNFVLHKGTSTIRVRTYERGVEGETLSCGTGALASAIITYFQKNVQPPVTVIPRSGDPLIVDFKIENSAITDVSLTGPYEYHFRGEAFYNPVKNRITSKNIFEDTLETIKPISH